MWLIPRETPYSLQSLSVNGQVRVARWRQSPVTVRPTGAVDDIDCPFVKGLRHPGGTIRHSPVSFLSFTMGAHAPSFGVHLFRFWFCWWLGLDLPRSLAVQQAEKGRPAQQRGCCKCGAQGDTRGFHRLACNQGDLQALARTRGHDSIADAVAECAAASGMPNKTRHDVPALPGTDNQRGDLSITVRIPPSHGQTPTEGIIGDVTLISMDTGANTDPSAWGAFKPRAMRDSELSKNRHYKTAYASGRVPWTFVPLACSTYGHLRPNFLRLINFMAEQQARRSLEADMLGEPPEATLKLCRHRQLARVACAVAVATAMRLGEHWEDIHYPVRLAPRRAQVLPYVPETDLPLFPLGTEGAPVATAFPLPRGGPSVNFFDDGGGDGGGAGGTRQGSAAPSVRLV